MSIEKVINKSFDTLEDKIDNILQSSIKFDKQSLYFLTDEQKEYVYNITIKNRKLIDKEMKDTNKIKPTFCEHISQKMSSDLNILNINHSIAYGSFDENPHVWIEFEDGELILDITADQFGDFPKIWFPADNEHYSTWETQLIEY